MKKYLVGLTVVLLVLFMANPGVFAYSINVGDKIQFINAEGNTGGGEFGIDKINPSDGWGELFRTFCVQRTQFIDYSGEGFIVSGITNYADDTSGNDFLNDETAYLYVKFINHTLSGYDYSPGTSTHIEDADDLQYVIWTFEGEYSGSLSTQALAWRAEALSAVSGSDGWRNNGQVKIMNLTYATTRDGHAAGSNAQDQLIYVPEPSTLLFLGASLLGLGFAIRRRKS